MFANLEWFKSQTERQYDSVPFGALSVRVQSLTVIERATIAAAALAHAKKGEAVDTQLFSQRQEIGMLAASIVDEKGARVFQDTDAHYAILEGLRAKIGKPIEDAIQALSMPDKAETETKNLPAVPG